MGSDARAERRRRARAEAKGAGRPGYDVRPGGSLDVEADYATMVAWCAAEADLPETRRQTHDGLIALMGDRRRGGIQWRQWTGPEAAEALHGLWQDATPPDLADHYRRVAGHLREYGGWLVLAMARGDRP